MRVKHDLRAELAIIASRATDLEKALLALPETEDDMAFALMAMPREERVQAAEYVRRLGQTFYTLRQHCLWVRQQLQSEEQR